MLRKNRKKSRSSKEYEPPSKIRLRKYLNADALFMAIRREFEKIPEFQTEDIEISTTSDEFFGYTMTIFKNYCNNKLFVSLCRMKSIE
jgi:hypothetical protein